MRLLINYERGARKMGKLSIASELWSYLKIRKKWWLLPILLFLLIIGTLLILAEGSVVAPLIYTLF
jgi:hypothetical protein